MKTIDQYCSFMPYTVHFCSNGVLAEKLHPLYRSCGGHETILHSLSAHGMMRLLFLDFPYLHLIFQCASSIFRGHNYFGLNNVACDKDLIFVALGVHPQASPTGKKLSVERSQGRLPCQDTSNPTSMEFIDFAKTVDSMDSMDSMDIHEYPRISLDNHGCP